MFNLETLSRDQSKNEGKLVFFVKISIFPHH